MIEVLISVFTELDSHLLGLVNEHGGWTYILMFAVLACEVGLVITPFLPGESLLFAAGALAATEALSLPVLLVGFTLAAIAGNVSGYAIGKGFRMYVATGRKLPFIDTKNLEHARELYEKNPVKTVIFSRFLPFVRALAPFVAGVAGMPFQQFLAYSVTGGLIWAVVCTLAGFAFGQVPIVKDNFSLCIALIIVVSFLPGLFSYAFRRIKTPAK